MTTMIQCLELIASNYGGDTVKGNAIINNHIKDALSEGYVTYTPRRKAAYALTERGKVFLSSARTGIPMPAKR